MPDNPSPDPMGEKCESCGELVAVSCPTYWTAPDELWNAIEGGPTGKRCIPCFTNDAAALGVPIHWEAHRA